MAFDSRGVPSPDEALRDECTHFLLHQPGVLFRTLRQMMCAPELLAQGPALVTAEKWLLLGHGSFNIFCRLILLYGELWLLKTLQDVVV